MKRLFLAGAVGCCLGLSSFGQTSPLFEIRGLVSNPQVDATAMVNYGSLSASGSLPFEPQNTLFYTNQGNATMTGVPGFLFDFVTNNFRYPASTFVNRGTVSANFLSSTIVVSGGAVVSYGGKIVVSATNISSSGLLDVSVDGLVRLEGQQIDLTRGGLRSGLPAAGSGTSEFGRGTTTPPTYTDGTGVSDMTASIRTNRTRLSPLSTSFTGYQGFVYSNTPASDTNEFVQIVLVNTNTLLTNVTAEVGFVDPIVFDQAALSNTVYRTDRDTTGRMAIVRFLMPDIDSVTGQPITNVISLMDFSVVLRTDVIMLTNSLVTSGRRPSPFETIRSTPTEWLSKVAANFPFTNSLIYNPNYLVDTVTNVTASYMASLSAGNIPNLINYGATTGLPFRLDPTDPTNYSGRVEIIGGQLDLTRARIKSDGLVSIKADNLVGNSALYLDAPMSQFELTSTNSSLIISNLVLPMVSRLSGSVTVTSYVYTNSYTNDVATNGIESKIHLMVVDSTLTTKLPVSTYALTAHATNVIIADNLSVTRSFVADADNLTVLGGLSLPSQYGSSFSYQGDGSAGVTNFPHLLNLTNQGVISISGIGNFGSDRAQPFASFVNHGQITGYGLNIRADSFENSGTARLSAFSGPIRVQAAVAKLDGGVVSATGNFELVSGDAKARNSSIQSGATIILNATDRLTDGGSDASNRWVCNYGFQLLNRPAAGDLLGTMLVSTAAQFTAVSHLWAGENRGTNMAGYSNNVAIGRLVLDGGPFSQFAFAGTGTNNALYVDYLDLKDYATNVQDALALSPNLTLYFAAASMPVEKLDGLFGGQLRWVRHFAGPNSSTNVVLANGQTNKVNLAFRQSATIDSDADGLVNGQDSKPFDGVKFTQVTVTNLPPVTTLISWKAAALTDYRVEFATNLINTSWQLLTNYSNTSLTNNIGTVQDAAPQAGSQRYYRVSYTP